MWPSTPKPHLHYVNQGNPNFTFQQKLTRSNTPKRLEFFFCGLLACKGKKRVRNGFLLYSKCFRSSKHYFSEILENQFFLIYFAGKIQMAVTFEFEGR